MSFLSRSEPSYHRLGALAKASVVGQGVRHCRQQPSDSRLFLAGRESPVRVVFQLRYSIQARFSTRRRCQARFGARSAVYGQTALPSFFAPPLDTELFIPALPERASKVSGTETPATTTGSFGLHLRRRSRTAAASTAQGDD